MADLAETIALDSTRETDGVDVPWIGDIVLRIARSGNPRHQKRDRELQQEYLPMLRAGGDAAAQAAEQIEIRLLAETIFLGFVNIADEGKPVEDTLDGRMALLRKYRILREFVTNRALMLSPYLLRRDGDGQGNS